MFGEAALLGVGFAKGFTVGVVGGVVLILLSRPLSPVSPRIPPASLARPALASPPAPLAGWLSVSCPRADDPKDGGEGPGESQRATSRVDAEHVFPRLPHV